MRRDVLLPAIAGAAIVVSSLAYGRCAAAFGGTWPTIAAYVVLTLAGLAGTRLAWARDDAPLVAIVLVTAVAARLALVPLPPLHSLDAYRYLWDGAVLRFGHDPYVLRPDDFALVDLRIAYPWLYAHVDWTAVPTLYPPFDLALFRIAAAFGLASLRATKLIMLAGDLLALAAVYAGLRRATLPRGRVALYGWSALAITEFGLEGHEEGWAIAGIVVALVAASAGRSAIAGVALAEAVLTKLYPLALVPALFWRRRDLAAVGIVALAVALAYLPFALRDSDVFGFLRTFALGYAYNDSLHLFFGNAGSAVALGGIVATAFLARRRGAAAVPVALGVVTAYLLLSANVYPWYLTILLALLPVVAGRGAFAGPLGPLGWGLVGWTVLSPLAYVDTFVYAQDSLGDRIAHAVEYLPLALATLAYAARPRTTLVALRASFFPAKETTRG